MKTTITLVLTVTILVGISFGQGRSLEDAKSGKPHPLAALDRESYHYLLIEYSEKDGKPMGYALRNIENGKRERGFDVVSVNRGRKLASVILNNAAEPTAAALFQVEINRPNRKRASGSKDQKISQPEDPVSSRAVTLSPEEVEAAKNAIEKAKIRRDQEK